QDRPKSSDGRGKPSSVADRRRAGRIVLATAAASRVVMVVLFFAFDAIIEDYDTSARIYSPCRPRHVSPGNSSAVDRTLTLLGISHASNGISDESTLANVATGRIGFVPTVARAREWVLRRLPPELFSTSLIEDYPGHNYTVFPLVQFGFFYRVALTLVPPFPPLNLFPPLKLLPLPGLSPKQHGTSSIRKPGGVGFVLLRLHCPLYPHDTPSPIPPTPKHPPHPTPHTRSRPQQQGYNNRWRACWCGIRYSSTALHSLPHPFPP
ncbi:unnamed protein product, partial [Closterium sp. NIES-54]